MTSLKPALVAACIVIAGFVIRLPGLADPPLDFHPTRQYRSAIIARSFVPDLLRNVTPASRQAAETAAGGLPPIEPPVMEHLAAWVYHLIGREDLAWARALAVIAWSLGGLAIFWLAIQVVTPPAALAAVTVWTFLPFAIRASMSFQPDPLMTALTVFTLAAALQYQRAPRLTSGILFAAGLAAALAVKAMAVFFLGPALFALLLLGPGTVRLKGSTIGIAVVAMVPAALYYTRLPLASDYGPFVQLLREPEFWRGWAIMIGRVVSWPVMVAGLAGIVFATADLRRMLIALFAGYAAFGVVFTHHIHTHDYYSLPLVPIAALGVAALVDGIARRARRSWTARVPAAIAGVACFVAGLVAVTESRGSERVAALKAEASRYEQIGALVGHSERVLALDGAYALPLIYYGYVSTSNWPLSGDLAVLPLTGRGAGPAAARLESSGAEFFVCTIQPELDAQPELAGILQRQYPILKRDGAPERWAYVIYDLRRGVLSVTPAHLSLFLRVGGPGVDEAVALFAPASSHWTVATDAASLSVQPREGTGPATLRVAAAAQTSTVDRAEKVIVTSAAEGSVTLDVRVRAVAGIDQPPFGSVDSPPNPVTLGRDPIMFQGWALDDTSMKRVWVGYDAGGGIVRLGDAVREGWRPDVAAAYPAAHDLFRAAWAFKLDPEAIRAVRRPLQLRFFAEDGEGQRAEIGRRTVR